jgi:hypothetical protein
MFELKGKRVMSLPLWSFLLAASDQLDNEATGSRKLNFQVGRPARTAATGSPLAIGVSPFSPPN